MGQYGWHPLIYTLYLGKNIFEIRCDLLRDAPPLDVSGHSFACSDFGVPSLRALCVPIPLHSIHSDFGSAACC